MISNQLLQKTIDEFKSIIYADMAILEPDGKTTVKTTRTAEVDPEIAARFAASDKEFDTVAGYSLLKVKEEGQTEYLLAVKDVTREGETIGKMAKYQIETMLVAYRERFDKDNFIKSLLMDNLMLVDIFSRAKKLHIDLEIRRCVFLIEMQDKNQDDAIGTIRNVFAGSSEDFAVAMDRKTIVVVKHVESNDSYEAMDQVAKRIFNAVKSDIGEEILISFGTIVTELKDVSRSYREAKMAMDVGRIFFKERRINSYNHLGIGRIVYQLSIPLCKLFIDEIFGENTPDSFDEETLSTINKFFENSLNVSETSRQLYIHRNTLVYRLDKIQKTTGLDLRVFEDAITFKIALMVSNYMQYIEEEK